ncbi:hypothetical protein ACFY8X_08795 [Streptomyces tanashiensis]|uniref:Septation ring formation regulator EzrA n=1 Tax=Streptomyces tanashiensis TaxID=67367 RepID=A0ABY6R2A0_9ACTN|nr:hypothetical protein [Streptomyces tanashiensis]UZX24191.1 hypothetical protein LDH80_27350 [Streptomyces tanashiensis]
MAVALPLLVGALLPQAFAGGGTRRWFGGRGEGQRAEAQAAKDAAAAAFYELDTAQRGLRISIETITAVDSSPEARRAVEGFEALGRRIDEVSHLYIGAVDAHDLDRDELDAGSASRARADLNRAKEELDRVKGELDRFEEGLAPLLGRAETQLAQLAPAVERARQALRGASGALDVVREGGLRADDLAARLASLGPELTRLNEGAGRHGVAETLQRADRVLRDAEAVRAEAERLPERAAETDKRLVSLRTRTEALTTRAGGVEPVLSELRRRYSAACWQDLQHVPEQAVVTLRQAGERLAEAGKARAEQRWPDATSLLSTARALLDSTDEAVSAAGERLRRLDAVAKDPKAEIDRTRFAVRDAQRLAMAGRNTPDPRHARPLDDAVGRLDRAVDGLEGRHPDYWHFLTELEAVRAAAARVVALIREERGSGVGH